MEDEDRPLILTLMLDAASMDRFESLRRAHFPPERNVIPAHVSLFHALPGHALGAVLRDLEEAARAATFPVCVGGVRSLGRGVAYRLSSPELAALRGGLARRWAGLLGAQDRATHDPHVTVQNKVSAEQARALLAALSARFVPWTARGERLALWRYRGGPWEALADLPLRQCPTA